MPGGVHGHDVGVALDDDDLLGAQDVPFRPVVSVQDPGFVVQGTVGGVDVFTAAVRGPLLLLVEGSDGAAGEPDGFAVVVMQGPHDAVDHAVAFGGVAGSGVGGDDGSGEGQDIGGCRGQRIGQRGAGGGGVTDTPLRG